MLSLEAMKPVYLDNAATTSLDDEIRACLRPTLEEAFGNPSSRHPLGTASARAVDRARDEVAEALGAEPENVVFTSGGTEANNLAVLGFARRRGPGHVWVGPTEHPSVGESAEALGGEGFEVEVGSLDSKGGLDLDALAESLREDTVLVAQMLANNEFGTVYPVQRLVRLVRARAPRAHIHVDAVQAFGKLDVRLAELGADSLSISAHKIHGPKGAGALVCRGERRPVPLVFGGGQEAGVRSGTENVTGIVGLGAAARVAAREREHTAEHSRALQTRFRERLAGRPDIQWVEPGDEHLPNIVALSVPGAPAEVYLHHLEEQGIYVGAGSACHSNKRDISPALRALGFDERRARSVLRISFSRLTEPDDVDVAARALEEIIGKLGSLTT